MLVLNNRAQQGKDEIPCTFQNKAHSQKLASKTSDCHKVLDKGVIKGKLWDNSFSNIIRTYIVVPH